MADNNPPPPPLPLEVGPNAPPPRVDPNGLPLLENNAQAAADPNAPPPLLEAADPNAERKFEDDGDAIMKQDGGGLFGSTVTVDDSSFDTLIRSADGFGNGKEGYVAAVETVRGIFTSPDRFGVDTAIKAANALIAAGKALRAGGQVPVAPAPNPLPAPAAKGGSSRKSRHVTPKRRRSARQGLSKKKRHSRK